MQAVQLDAARIVCQVMDGRNLSHALSVLQSSANHPSPQQRAALQDLSYGTLRHYGRLLGVLQQLLRKPVPDDQLRCLLLVALYQLQFSKAPPYAVVDHAVHATRRINSKASGLVNAILRNFLRNRAALFDAAASSEEGRYSYQQWWIDAIKAQYGGQAEAILLAGNLHPPMTLRVNRRRIKPADYLALLQQQNIPARLIELEAVLLQKPMAVEMLPGFFDGLVSVQDAGAQYAAGLLEVHDGMRVLDACAAPGGKSSHLLELADIDLLALDKDEGRLQRIRENLQRLQVSARVQCGSAAQPDGWWDGKPFHRILADVPCSASGVVRRHPDIKWLRRPEDIDSFARQQLQILCALWRLLARDGKLLYATCSVFARENSQVISKFLQQHEDARELALFAPGLNDGQLLPNETHDGFFYALLHKSA
ncbi:MAG: 16S rRNA (cytosine(967)-C(5))-methyltransferase RsmB [Gallionellaceae bacterium]